MKKRWITGCFVLAFLISCMGMSTGTQAAKVALNKKRVTITVGSSIKLKLKNTKRKVTWKSSKKKIATVTKKGLVKAKKKGKTTITAKVGKKKYICRVTVKAKKSSSNTVSKSPQNSTSSANSSQNSNNTKATAKPLPTENPAHRDDGWVPGWY